jgi:hypothetical protein
MRITAARKHSALSVYIQTITLFILVNAQCVHLDVCYDNHMSFTPHVNEIVAKASGRAKLISKYVNTNETYFLARAFCTFVIFALQSAVWCPLKKRY